MPSIQETGPWQTGLNAAKKWRMKYEEEVSCSKETAMLKRNQLTPD